MLFSFLGNSESVRKSSGEVNSLDPLNSVQCKPTMLDPELLWPKAVTWSKFMKMLSSLFGLSLIKSKLYSWESKCYCIFAFTYNNR